MKSEEAYLRAILATVARQTFPPEIILEIVGSNEKQLRAFNMCDGTRTQGEIVKLLGLDKGNFSRTLGRWVDAGIAVRVGTGSELRPVHVYPLPESLTKKVLTQ